LSEPGPDRASVRRLLDELGVRPSKRLGQNFLVDRNVVAGILDAVGGDTDSAIVEIGPGLGALTLPLAKRARRLVAVEVDRRLAARLRDAPALQADSVEVVEADILRFDLGGAASSFGERVVVVGSIPYSITAPILSKLVDSREAVRVAFLVTQREVAENILASPGADGTALGIFVQAYADVAVLRRIPRGAFYPVPDVDSCLWKLEMLERPRFTAKEERFFTVVRAIYGARRKTLRNGLQREYPRGAVDAMLVAAGLDGGTRGETLGFAELNALAVAAEVAAPYEKAP